mgnify:CR=1 FL=1
MCILGISLFNHVSTNANSDILYLCLWKFNIYLSFHIKYEKMDTKYIHIGLYYVEMIMST